MKIESILAKIAGQVFQSKNFIDAQKSMLSLLENSNVKDRDKMIMDTKSIKTLTKLQMYFANSLLKYEGLSVNKNKPTYEQD